MELPLSIDLFKQMLHDVPMLAFNALADPTRRRIVEMLAAGERAAGEIVREFEVSAPAISQHLKVLKEARLVRVRAAAQKRIYALDAAGIGEIDRWLERIRRFWGGRLDALERELKDADRRERKKRERKR
jgi:DNA-binding transcriptional ArsR family regulator